jgi:hypothetical protein
MKLACPMQHRWKYQLKIDEGSKAEKRKFQDIWKPKFSCRLRFQ